MFLMVFFKHINIKITSITDVHQSLDVQQSLPVAQYVLPSQPYTARPLSLSLCGGGHVAPQPSWVAEQLRTHSSSKGGGATHLQLNCDFCSWLTFAPIYVSVHSRMPPTKFRPCLMSSYISWK